MNIDLYGLFPYGDSDGVKAFTLAHRFAHDAERDAIAAKLGRTLGTYAVGGDEAVEPWIEMMQGRSQGIPQAMSDWLQLHNDNHQSMLSILSPSVALAAVDLSIVDFRSADQMYEWLTLHQAIHQYEQQALGL